MKKKIVGIMLAAMMTAVLASGCGNVNVAVNVSDETEETADDATETDDVDENEDVDDQAKADEVAALIDAIF